MRTLKISWADFENIFPIFESVDAEETLWHKEETDKFIFLFHKQFDIVCEVNKFDLLMDAGMLEADAETKEQFFSDFRNRYLSVSRPFISFGGL